MSTYTISEKPSSDRMWLVKKTMSHSYSALQCLETMDVFASREGNCRIDVVDKFHEKNEQIAAMKMNVHQDRLT